MTGGFLDLTGPESPGFNLSVQDLRIPKQPSAAAVTPLCDINPTYERAEVLPVLFETLTESVIRQAAMRT